MFRHALFATLLSALPVTVFAAGPTPGTGSEPQVAVPAPAPVRTGPALAFTLRGGVGVAPEYFGSRKMKAGPDGAISLEFLRLPGGQSFGSADPRAERFGFAPRGSFRYIDKRSAARSPELTGLNDVKRAVELGLGLGYSQRNFEAFADVRHGFVGHKATVAELGADLVLRPGEGVVLRAGPRVLAASGRYNRTYFGVTPAESLASGLAAHAPRGGVVSAGLELGATWAFDDRWGLDGAIRWDRLTGDAGRSPIVAQGRRDQVSLRLGVTRRFTLGL